VVSEVIDIDDGSAMETNVTARRRLDRGGRRLASENAREARSECRTRFGAA